MTRHLFFRTFGKAAFGRKLRSHNVRVFLPFLKREDELLLTNASWLSVLFQKLFGGRPFWGRQLASLLSNRWRGGECVNARFCQRNRENLGFGRSTAGSAERTVRGLGEWALEGGTGTRRQCRSSWAARLVTVLGPRETHQVAWKVHVPGLSPSQPLGESAQHVRPLKCWSPSPASPTITK